MEPLTFRTRLAQGLAILVAVIAVVALVAYATEAGPTAALTSVAPVALVVALGWAVLWRPRAVVDEDGVTLVNIVRTVRVPWQRFRSADTRWALSITTTQGRTYSSWAVPAGSGFGSRLAPSGRMFGEHSPADRKLASAGTAEAAAVAIGERVPDRRAQTVRGGAVGGGDVTVTANTTVIAVLGALALLTAVSVALG